MFRLASILALACLTLAATAVLTAPNRLVEDQPQSGNDRNDDSKNRLAALGAERTVSFHARFSLN
jgi:hypothetical protein